MRAATSDARFLYLSIFAAWAGLVLLTEYFEVFGEVSGVAIGVSKVFEGGTTNFN